MKYIGLDAHPSTSTFVVIREDGVEVKNATIETNGRLILTFLKDIGGRKKIAFEECELSQWLYSVLRKRINEEDIIVCNPVKNKKYKGPKNDKLDAKNLADLLRGNFLSPVYHDGSEREKYRALVSGYQDLVQEVVSMKCRYKSLYRKEGKNVRGEKVYKGESLLGGIERKDLKFVADRIQPILEVTERELEVYQERIKKENKKFGEIKYLKSLPGIKDIQAAKIVSQVITPERFRDKYKYYVYCGLIRHKKSSAGKDCGSEKVWGNMTLKTVYKMAGRSALRGRSGLRKYYDQKCSEGMHPGDAYNAVCRKIAALSLSLWRNKQRYDDKEFIKNHLKENR
jgi:transposase